MASTTRLSSTLASILYALPALGGVLACGDSTATTSATTSTSDATTATGTATDTTTTTTTATTEAVTTTATMGGTTTTTATTTTDATTETTTTTTGVTSVTTDATETTAVTTETTSDTTTGETTETSTTGEPVGATCEQDSDCQLFTDCCTCDVLANDESPPPCGLPECFVPVCETLDIGAGTPVCRFGRCTFEKVTCNPIGVTCKSQPPDCPQGQLPSVQGDCWSGQCTPVEACDWVPDCGACKLDIFDPLVCVFKAQKGAYHVCEPKPVGCGDEPEIDCDCGSEICDASPPHTVCSDQVPGIICECPNC